MAVWVSTVEQTCEEPLWNTLNTQAIKILILHCSNRHKQDECYYSNSTIPSLQYRQVSDLNK